jgi:ATP-binding cassette subfamily B (MDR/TAP) protein 1
VFETLRASAWKDSKGLSFLFFIMYFMSGVGIIAAAQFIADDPEYDAGVYMEVSMNVMWGSMMLGMVTMIAMPYKLAITASRKMLLIIQRVPAIDAYATDGLAPSPTTPGELMLRNVRFAYPKAPGTTVLKGVSLTVPPGSVTALVGGSGSGKSTVIRLLQRLYDPIEGVVLLDGVPLRSLNVKELRKVLGVVSQEPLLFNCSIEENIRLGAAEGSGDADAPPVTQAEIEEACRVANALEFIQQDQENGFQTIVGRGGGKLSGGQKQRIAIARAMVRRPRVLLLDEATSALDENSQELVQANVEAKMRELGGTTVMVAHRQTTYMNASCIVCFCNGHISEHATSDISDAGGAHDGSAHSKLMRNNGEYHALFTGCTAEEAKAREEAKAVEAKAAAVVKADDVKPIVKLERTMSDDEKTLRRTISQKVAAIGPPQALQRLDTPPKRCCNYIQRVIAMLGPQALQKKDFRWVIPCLMVFSALYGAAIPGMMLINAEAFVNFGRCLPTYSPANRTLVMLDPVALDLCHDEMISTANVYAALYFGFSFCALGLCYIKQVSLQLSIACVSRSLRNAVFGNVVRQEFAWFDDASNSPFAISSRLADDADLVAKAYGQPLSSVADMIVALALAYSVALAASWQLVFATVAILPLMAHGARKQHGMREGSQKRAQNMIAEASTIAGDAGQDIGTVAAFSMQEAVHTMYEGKVNERVGEGVKYAAGVAATFMFQETGRYLNQFIVYCYGSHLGGAGHITGADIIRADQAITGATFSTMSGVGQLPDLAKAQSAQGTIFTIIDRQSHIDTLASMDAAFAAGGSGGDAAAKPSGDCGFDLKGVSFSYPSAKDKLALVDVNLQIRGGESTALVGGSGSGKTTIVKLLQRLYDPSLGTVLFDGHDLSGVDPAWLRRQLAVVGQEPVLYNASIMDNVKYGGPLDPETGEPTATDEQAIAACKRANAHDFVEKLPEGYQTQVQRSGGSLSGGQKQRIAIARAIIREPYVFLLDEATSALDSQSESTVKEALERETAGK